jgi:hypothetical protein
LDCSDILLNQTVTLEAPEGAFLDGKQIISGLMGLGTALVGLYMIKDLIWTPSSSSSSSSSSKKNGSKGGDDDEDELRIVPTSGKKGGATPKSASKKN